MEKTTGEMMLTEMNTFLSANASAETESEVLCRLKHWMSTTRTRWNSLSSQQNCFKKYPPSLILP